jgi:hypothetical protein
VFNERDHDMIIRLNGIYVASEAPNVEKLEPGDNSLEVLAITGSCVNDKLALRLSNASGT